MNLAVYVVSDQHAAQGSFLAFHFTTNIGVDVRNIQPHDAKLHHRPVALPSQQNLAGVMVAGDPRLQHLHVNR